MPQSSSATQFLLRLVPLSLVLAGACARGVSRTGTDPRALAPPAGLFRLETVEWSEPYSGPLGYPKGAQRASLGVDSRTGGETYYARFPAGTRFELHWHAYAEYAVVLRGRVTHTLGDESTVLMPGDYVVIPAQMHHGWAVDPSSDAYILIRRDGPPDFNFIAR